MWKRIRIKVTYQTLRMQSSFNQREWWVTDTKFDKIVPALSAFHGISLILTLTAVKQHHIAIKFDII